MGLLNATRKFLVGEQVPVTYTNPETQRKIARAVKYLDMNKINDDTLCCTTCGSLIHTTHSETHYNVCPGKDL